ncbi:helix-turn-helix domain-containing protein [Herbiconiux sp. KACC 21604]|uniref:PucR family transcriptional regulator n=1 Tax=unclassified Herbiconiux TaxID=2618217 RepID=UPI001492F36E|nr:helix-turn-helix domain-containing protein [Herbiconiux sp. SALV-R1]QJU53459.1 helix-turn-helix domain-containing protein [Herbiconiux sp. SALV-R1]WPO88431.1 helix-turn-helix domain-containing protein [Herbiconiux sp. KACC 21604]
MHNELDTETGRGMAEALRPTLLPLLEDPSVLVDEFIREFHNLQGYESAIVGEVDLRESNHRAVEYLIRTLLHASMPADLVDFPIQLGRKRARQGVPFNALSRAVRLNFSVLWRYIMAHNLPADELFLTYSAEFWKTLDLYVEDVQASYLDEANARGRNSAQLRDDLFRLLMLSGGGDRDAVRRLSASLGVDPGAQFRVVHARPGRDGEVLRLGQQLERQGIRAISHRFDEVAVLLVVVTDESRDFAAIRAVNQLDCSVSPVAHGVSQLPAAIEFGRALADVRPHTASGSYGMTLGWPRVLVSGMGRIGEMFADEVLSALLELPEAEREVHVETARVYLRTGSVGDTAKTLFCHRNTVVNRLNRIRELTEHDLSVPRDAAAFILALEYRGFEV